MVTLFRGGCLQPPILLKDLEYRFVSQDGKSQMLMLRRRLDNLLTFSPIACNRFQEMVYGKKLELSVNIHKLRLEATRRKETLCENAVLRFWSDPLDSGSLVDDHIMLYFAGHGTSREPKELPSKTPNLGLFSTDFTNARSAIFLEAANFNKPKGNAIALYRRQNWCVSYRISARKQGRRYVVRS